MKCIICHKEMGTNYTCTTCIPCVHKYGDVVLRMAYSIKSYPKSPKEIKEEQEKYIPQQHTSAYVEPSIVEIKCDINDYQNIKKQKGKDLKYIKCRELE
jgi:hypothetical protein